MGHFPEYLSDDPHFPCNAIDAEYVNACYFYQSSRMSQVLGGDFEKVANACTEAPLSSHSVCFTSMGRDIGGNARTEPRRAIALCGHVIDPTNCLDCLERAGRDTFWDESGADLALEFCSAVC